MTVDYVWAIGIVGFMIAWAIYFGLCSLGMSIERASENVALEMDVNILRSKNDIE